MTQRQPPPDLPPEVEVDLTPSRLSTQKRLTGTLEDYTSDILELVEEGDRVSGKLRFHGLHRRTLFGEPPTDRRVWWYGAPIFRFEGPLVRDLWVLGDVHGLRSRLDPAWADRLSFKQA